MAKAPPSPRLVVGEYELHDVIGEGGHAVVHVGRKRGVPGFSPVVAIKRLKPALADDHHAVTALIDEAKTCALVHHPNVVRVLDVVQEEREVMLVLELVVGASLSTLMRRCLARGERVPPSIACALVAGMLRGLCAAHEARRQGELVGLIHRDVSPENLLVDEHGTAKLADFGIARARGRVQATAPDVLKGKLRYMAPEYLMGEAIDARVDVHAAGVVLWEALTGLVAFQGDDDAVIQSILSADLAPPSTLVDVPPELDRVVVNSITAKASERYPTARAMLDAIEAAAPIATAREVAHWMAALVEEELSILHSAVAVLEREATRVDIVPRDVHTAPDAAPRRASIARHKAAIASLVAMTIFGVVVVFALVLPRSPQPPSLAAEPPTSPLPKNEVLSPPQDLSVTSSTTDRSIPRQPPAHHGTRAPLRSKGCEPPWTFDDKGIKHYKDECL